MTSILSAAVREANAFGRKLGHQNRAFLQLGGELGCGFRSL